MIGLPSYDRYANTMLENVDGQYKLKHFTYIFNVFVFLQIFNEINCRKIGIQDFNVFDKFFHNFYFLAITIGTFSL